MEESGTVTVLVHPDDYEVLKKGFEVISGAFSEVPAEPLFTSPPEVVTDVVDAKEGCSHDFMPSPFGFDQCTKCGRMDWVNGAIIMTNILMLGLMMLKVYKN